LCRFFDESPKAKVNHENDSIDRQKHPASVGWYIGNHRPLGDCEYNYRPKLTVAY
jgi:hypothetical protein